MKSSKAQGHGRQGLWVLGPLRARGRLLPGAQVAGRGLLEMLRCLLQVLCGWEKLDGFGDRYIDWDFPQQKSSILGHPHGYGNPFNNPFTIINHILVGGWATPLKNMSQLG